MNARREVLKALATLPAAVMATDLFLPVPAVAQTKPARVDGSKLKTSLNAYSFNAPLLAGTMTLDDLLEFCARLGFDGVDLTGYYFPGYPEVPKDEYLYHIKRKAHLLGLSISGTGIRNDFTEPDEAKRASDVDLIKRWVVAASKLGAPVLRIFAGKLTPVGFTRDQVESWMVKKIAECVAFGRDHGVIVAIQNHNDFIKTADDALQILRRVDDPWFGLILDTGSFRSADPYAEIARVAGHAVNWQVKELIYVGDATEKTDLKRLVPIIRASGYRGYLPIETLGAGDPKEKVTALFHELVAALGSGPQR